MAFVYAWIVPSWADQLLPQLLMEQFDTLPIQPESWVLHTVSLRGTFGVD